MRLKYLLAVSVGITTYKFLSQHYIMMVYSHHKHIFEDMSLFDVILAVMLSLLMSYDAIVAMTCVLSNGSH